MNTAGQLRETVALQNPPGVDDGAGGRTGAWTTVATLRAKVLALTGTEATLAGAETGIAHFTVTIRRRTVTTAQRLVWLGLEFDIRAVLPRPDRVWLDLSCDAVPA